jgi:hypothetical protein
VGGNSNNMTNCYFCGFELFDDKIEKGLIIDNVKPSPVLRFPCCNCYAILQYFYNEIKIIVIQWDNSYLICPGDYDMINVKNRFRGGLCMSYSRYKTALKKFKALKPNLEIELINYEDMGKCLKF